MTGAGTMAGTRPSRAARSAVVISVCTPTVGATAGSGSAELTAGSGSEGLTSGAGGGGATAGTGAAAGRSAGAGGPGRTAKSTKEEAKIMMERKPELQAV